MKLSLKIILLTPFLFLFACGNVKSGSEEGIEEEVFEGIEDLEGDFQITAINGIDVSSEDIILKVNSEGNSLSVSAGCNILFSNYTIRGGNIIVEAPVGTEMYCQGKMKNEEALAIVLPKISKLTQHGDKYLFLSRTNEALLSVLKKEERE